MILKEHNGRLLSFANDFRNKCQKEMFSFADKLAKAQLLLRAPLAVHGKDDMLANILFDYFN